MAERALDLEEGSRTIVEDILRRLVPGRPVYVFGSRAKGRARRRSDLDLAVGGSQKLTFSEYADLKYEFSESDLPIFVDVVDLNTVDATFLKRIEPELLPLIASQSHASPRDDDRQDSEDVTPAEEHFDKLREECGVMAIYNHSDAARLTYWGLYALQHRGQESAGIATSDGYGITDMKGMGLVSEDLHRSRPWEASRPHRHRPHPLFDHG